VKKDLITAQFTVYQSCYFHLGFRKTQVFKKANPVVFGGVLLALGFIGFFGFYLKEQLGSLLDDLAHQLSFYLDLPVLLVI